MRSRWFPACVLIVIGLVFLAVNLGLIEKGSIRALFATWWPLIPLLLGISLLLGRGRCLGCRGKRENSSK